MASQRAKPKARMAAPQFPGATACFGGQTSIDQHLKVMLSCFLRCLRRFGLAFISNAECADEKAPGRREWSQRNK